jgi:hypothetical protein
MRAEPEPSYKAGTAVSKASGGTSRASSGISVATETCGKLSPPKSSSTVCEYWIWVDVTVIVVSTVISCGGFTLNLGPRPFGLGRGARMIKASWSGVQGGFRACAAPLRSLVGLLAGLELVATWY